MSRAKKKHAVPSEAYWPGDIRDQSWYCPRHGCCQRRRVDDKCVACYGEEQEVARIEDLWASLAKDLLKRARDRWRNDHFNFKTNEPFTLTVEDIEKVIPSDRKCPVLGFPFIIAGGMQPVFRRTTPYPTWSWRPLRWGVDASPALDKFEPRKGYVRGNIAVISSLANRIKSNSTDPEVLRKIADWMERFKREQTT
jgi:hypothetical protein